MSGIRAHKPAPRAKIDGLIYAVGDLHGRLDLLDRLIVQIKQDTQTRQDGAPTIIFLGDFIDRGPDSAGCIERLIALGAETWCVVETLRGNHEQVMMDFLESGEGGSAWIRYGGDATLKSYGVDLHAAAQGGWPTVRDALERALPPSHKAFLSQLTLSAEHGDYVFAHAGVRPGRSLEAQKAEDLLWIRREFLDAENPCPGKVVVHGHSAALAARLTRWTIGVDTGAYATGVLTAVRLRGHERFLLQAR